MTSGLVVSWLLNACGFGCGEKCGLMVVENGCLMVTVTVTPKIDENQHGGRMIQYV